MDIITHALIGAAIAPTPKYLLPMAAAGIIPDLWTVLPLTEYVFRHRGRYNNREFWRTMPSRYYRLRNWSHSIWLPVMVAAVSSLFWSTLWWLVIPWLVHIIVDLPTHALYHSTAVRPLYPISTWQFRGAFNWYDRLRFTVTVLALMALFVWWRWR
jgi:hypothetical protein